MADVCFPYTGHFLGSVSMKTAVPNNIDYGVHRAIRCIEPAFPNRYEKI